MICYNPSGMIDTVLVGEKTIVTAKGDGPTVDVSNAAGRVFLAMYDLLQKRDLAMKKYQSVLAENGSTPRAEKAREHIREAYRE